MQLFPIKNTLRIVSQGIFFEPLRSTISLGVAIHFSLHLYKLLDAEHLDFQL